MDVEKLIRQTFLKTVNSLEIPADIKQAALSHDTKATFFGNLKAHIMNARIDRIKQGKPAFKPATFEWWVSEMSKYYVSTVATFYEIKAKSEAEQTRLKRESDFKKDIDATISGKPQGDFADIVSIVGDGDAVERLEDDVL